MPFGSMYFNETWHICFVVLICYHEYIRKDLLEHFWRFCNPKFEKWKTRKSGLVPMLRQEKRAHLFLVFPAKLETSPKAFHSYSFIKRSRNKAFRHYFVNFIKRLPWKRRPLEKFRLQFWLYISKFYNYKVSLS